MGMYKQEATIKLRKLGLTIDDDKASYDALKLKYKALESDYNFEEGLYQSGPDGHRFKDAL